ncbi:MAG: hypothetical protein BGO54_07465 [Sphingobacteriales bacterium 46-32]|nr:MAG: hypothetical protein BGO54_07465 [Sphingobacteriales bacterium 46-32]
MSRLGNVTGFLVGEIIRSKDKEFSAIKNAALFLKIPSTTFFTGLGQSFSFAGIKNKINITGFEVAGFMLR